MVHNLSLLALSGVARSVVSGRRTSGQINGRRRRRLPLGTAVNRKRDSGKRRSWKNGRKKRIRRR